MTRQKKYRMDKRLKDLQLEIYLSTGRGWMTITNELRAKTIRECLDM